MLQLGGLVPVLCQQVPFFVIVIHVTWDFFTANILIEMYDFLGEEWVGPRRGPNDD